MYRFKTLKQKWRSHCDVDCCANHGNDSFIIMTSGKIFSHLKVDKDNMEKSKNTVVCTVDVCDWIMDYVHLKWWNGTGNDIPENLCQYIKCAICLTTSSHTNRSSSIFYIKLSCFLDSTAIR